MKEQSAGLVYGMYANTDSNRPSAHVWTTNEFDTRGTAAAATNTWTHLAATYDGTTLRIYANGTQVSTKTLSGNVIASTGALRIGGNAVWGEYFQGSIDEVRLYRRVLSAAEIRHGHDPVGRLPGHATRRRRPRTCRRRAASARSP